MSAASSFCPAFSCDILLSHVLTCNLCVQDLHLGYTRINNPSVAEREWRSYWGSAAGQKLRMQPLHLLTGSVLPLLPAIQKVAERHRGFGGRVQRLKVRRGQGAATQGVCWQENSCCGGGRGGGGAECRK
jgi:hypothetical protein